MRKLITIILCLLMLTGILSGCGAAPANNDAPENGEKLSIVATIFPEYDWVMNILGENAERMDVTMLLDSGIDLHSYQPTADDMIRISTCDLFIYVGGESDEWVEDALREAANKDMVVINLLEVLGNTVKEEEMVEGMQQSEHNHSHGEEIDQADIQDRALSEFAGEWKSLYPMLLSGELDAYIEHLAAEDEESAMTKETYLEMNKPSWICDVDKITIDGNTITFSYPDGTIRSAEYTYAGYSTKRNDDGDINSVLYQFETDSGDAPGYIQFNDHGCKPGEVEHFHVYFGDAGFEALMDESANPSFVPAQLSTDEVLESLAGHGHEHGAEMDEHVWLSLKNAAVLCGVIGDALAKLDSAHAGDYAANAAVYVEQLDELDAQYSAAVDAASLKTMVFADRFPFRYLVDDYGLSYYAAFSGCSAESEASFETVAFLAEKVDELGLSAVLTIEGASHKIAETVVSVTQAKSAEILSLDSMQSTTAQDVERGVTYIEVMANNLETLKTALR